MKFIHKIYEKCGYNTLVKLYILLFVRSSSKRIKWLKLSGSVIDEGCMTMSNVYGFQEPYMIKLGKRVYIASQCYFLTHDGALSWVPRMMGLTDKRTEKMGFIEIKDNCFIGFGSMIMQNITIGKNCIVAAGSVVTKDVPDNVVVGGAPAKVICSTEEFIEKNKNRNDYTCGWPIDKKRKYYEEKYKDRR